MYLRSFILTILFLALNITNFIYSQDEYYGFDYDYKYNLEVFSASLGNNNPDQRFTGANSSTIPGLGVEYFFNRELAVSLWGIHFDDALKFEDTAQDINSTAVRLNVTYKCPIYAGGLSYYFKKDNPFKAYVTGGLAFFKNQFLFTPVNAGANFMNNSHFEKTEAGYFFGAGGDYHLSKNYSLNLQFTKLFGDSQIEIREYDLPANSINAKLNLDRTMIRLGLRAWFH